MTESVTETAVAAPRNRYNLSRSNRTRSTSVISEVIAYLRRGGFGLAHRRSERLPLAEAVRIAKDHGDVLGVPDWTIAVRSHKNLDLSGAANEVEREAEHAGRDLWASIQHRRGHPIRDAYVTMPLHVFVKVLQLQHPDAVLPRQVEPDLVSAIVSKGGESS